MKLDKLPNKPADCISFKLDWNDSLKEFNCSFFSETQKVKNFIHSFIFAPIKKILKSSVIFAITDSQRSADEMLCIRKDYEKIWFDNIIKPQSLSNKNYWKEYFPSISSIKSLRNTFKPVDFTVETPDNVQLRGTIFHKSEKKNARTLLVCTGRSQIYQQGSFAWLLKMIKSKNLNINLVMYNPRGFGNSQGESSFDGFLIDAETMYQYIHQQLDVKEDLIDIYGYSLGGTTATRLKKLHGSTKGKIIHERSFVDSQKQIYYLVINYLGDNIFSSFIATIISWIFNIFGWNGSILEEWKSIQSKKLVIAHEKDNFIPFKASLYYALLENNLFNDGKTTGILLHPKEDRNHIVNHHTESLEHYLDPLSNNSALSIISNFLKN